MTDDRTEQEIRDRLRYALTDAGIAKPDDAYKFAEKVAPILRDATKDKR